MKFHRYLWIVLGLLLGCTVETKTSIISTMSFPTEADNSNSSDIDGDGEIKPFDNSFAGLSQNQLLVGDGLDFNAQLQAAIDLGTVAIGLRVAARDFVEDEKRATVEAFLADLGGEAPAFDGSD